MAITVTNDNLKYRESTSDPWKSLLINAGGSTMYFPNQTVNVASSAEIFRITDAGITTQTVVLECTFAGTVTNVTWTSYDGYIAFTGTCAAATTADVTLGNVSTPTPHVPLAIPNGGTGANSVAGILTNFGFHKELVCGQIMSGAGDYIYGYGVAELTYFGNLVRIDFSVMMETATYTGDTYGIDANLLDPDITPIVGGTLSYFKPNGTLDADRQGYGGTFEVSNNYWRPARIYTQAGAIGGWAASVIGSGERLVGTCFGTLS